jgi:DNA-directed RNA polymerase specialized sigma24 family protein
MSAFEFELPESERRADKVIYADPAPEVEGGRVQERLRPNLTGCTEAERKAYLSIEVGGITAEEYAAAEGKSASTIRTQLRRAREKVEGNP